MFFGILLSILAATAGTSEAQPHVDPHPVMAQAESRATWVELYSGNAALTQSESACCASARNQAELLRVNWCRIGPNRTLGHIASPPDDECNVVESEFLNQPTYSCEVRIAVECEAN